jgi:hypothetical protein
VERLAPYEEVIGRLLDKPTPANRTMLDLYHLGDTFQSYKARALPIPSYVPSELVEILD